jgi:hypothetical protein
LFLIAAFKGLRAMRARAPTLADTIVGYALYTTLVLFPLYAESRFLIPVYVWLFGAAWCWLAPQIARRPLARKLRLGS